MKNPAKEIISSLSGEWHKLKHGNPIPGYYPQTGAETVLVRGTSEVHGGLVVTNYEVVVTDRGQVVGRYVVRAEESAARIRSSAGD